MRKTRKYKRRKRKRTRKKRTRRKRGGMDVDDIDAPPLIRSSSAPSATIATEDFPTKEELDGWYY